MNKAFFLTVGLVIFTSSTALADPLRLGMTPEPYMPMTSIDAGGNWVGIEAELTKAVCDQIAEGCEIKQMAWDALIPSLKEEKVDFIVGAFSITDERSKIVDFSLPYDVPATYIIGAKSDKTEVLMKQATDGTGDVLSMDNIQDKYFGVQNSSSQAQYIAHYASDLNVKTYDTADTVLADLKAGRIDYAVLGDSFVKSFLKSEDGADYEAKLYIFGNPILGKGVAYAMRKGDTETRDKINAPLSKMLQAGDVQKILEKWGKGAVPVKAP